MTYFKDAEKEKKDKKEDGQSLSDKIDGLIESANKGGVEKPVLPDAPSYDRLEIKEQSPEETKKQAENKLYDYLETGKKNIEKEYESALSGANEQSGSMQKRLQQEKEQIDKAYSEYKRNVENDVLKRGLGRSSIAVNSVSQAESDKAQKLSEAQKSYEEGVASLEKKLSELEQKRGKALNDFNLGYAVKLAGEMDSIQSQLEQKKKDAIKYNNEISGKEYSDAIDKTMKESDLYSEKLSQAEKENGLAAALKGSAAQQRLYNTLVEELSKADKAEAKKIISDNALVKSSLSEYYYYKLFDQFGR